MSNYNKRADYEATMRANGWTGSKLGAMWSSAQESYGDDWMTIAEGEHCITSPDGIEYTVYSQVHRHESGGYGGGISSTTYTDADGNEQQLEGEDNTDGLSDEDEAKSYLDDSVWSYLYSELGLDYELIYVEPTDPLLNDFKECLDELMPLINKAQRIRHEVMDAENNESELYEFLMERFKIREFEISVDSLLDILKERGAE